MQFPDKMVCAADYALWHDLDTFDTHQQLIANLTPRGYAGGGNGPAIPVYRHADVAHLFQTKD